MCSFTDGFSGYHQINITKEDWCYKTTFASEWGCFEYTAMPFGLKNAPMIFSRIIVIAFKYFNHKFLEFYIDDWTVFGIIKHQIKSLRMMLECCCQYQIYLNLNKCFFCTPTGVLLVHVVCRNGILVDPTKITIILNLPPPTTVNKLRANLGQTRYYKNIIKGYAEVTALMLKMIPSSIGKRTTKRVCTH